MGELKKKFCAYVRRKVGRSGKNKEALALHLGVSTKAIENFSKDRIPVNDDTIDNILAFYRDTWAVMMEFNSGVNNVNDNILKDELLESRKKMIEMLERERDQAIRERDQAIRERDQAIRERQEVYAPRAVASSAGNAG